MAPTSMGKLRFGTFTTAGLALLALSSCMSSRRAVGVQQVDSLVGRVERVHLDAELGRERIQDAVAAVRGIVRQEFTGDAMQAYEEFVVAIERSEKQVEKLRSNLEPMQETAAEVYDSWTADLESFTSPTLRARSQQRRDLAGERYALVLLTMQPAIDGLEAYNSALRDHALFLSYDLNASAVRELEPELEMLRDAADVLDGRIDDLLRSASEFVRTTAPLGQVHLTGESVDRR